MLRPFVYVARPADWTGKLARAAVVAMGALLLLVALLVRLPANWVELVGGYPELVRVVLVLAVFWVMAWVRALLYSRLPAAPYLFWRTFVFRVRGRHRRVKVEEIVDVYVEQRPSPQHETFAVGLVDGSFHEVCPVAWSGAAKMYSVLAAKVERNRDAARVAMSGGSSAPGSSVSSGSLSSSPRSAPLNEAAQDDGEHDHPPRGE